VPVFTKYAQFYDTYYAQKNYEAEAGFVLDVAGRFGPPPGSVLDMGCGTGRHITEFLKRGLRCEGFDQSSGMLDQACQRLAGQEVRLSQANLTTFHSAKTYDLVVSLFAVIGYLVRNSDLIAGFRTARRHLNPGGVFVFDGWFGPAVLDQRPEYRRHEYRRDGELVVREATPTLDLCRQTVTVQYDLEISNDGRVLQHISEEHCMRLMFVQEIALAAEAAGLEIVHCCPFMEPDGQPNSKTWNVCFVARSITKDDSAATERHLPVDGIEWIQQGDQVLALIIRADYEPVKTQFISPPTYKQQIGFVVHPKGGAIIPHVHHELVRNLIGTSEVLLIRRGSCCIDFYLQDKSFHCTKELNVGDTVALVSGGHGFRMREDTVFLEVKQGPYIGEDEKERFAATR
jgi:SAM-dependent methyltransferase